jgi:hypothetical protein
LRCAAPGCAGVPWPDYPRLWAACRRAGAWGAGPWPRNYTAPALGSTHFFKSFISDCDASVAVLIGPQEASKMGKMGELWQTVPQWLTAFVFVALTLSVATSIWALSAWRSYKRLSHFPGPRSASLSKWWMIRATASGEMPFRLANACRQYGSLIRIGPNDLGHR